MAGKVLKSKNAKLPMKRINKKESTPKNSKITKESVKKSAETKSSAKKLDPVVDESPKKQSSKITEESSLVTPRASGRQRKVLDYNAMAKGLDSVEKKGTKRKADSVYNQDATSAKKKVVETSKRKEALAKKPLQGQAKKTVAKTPAKVPVMAPPKTAKNDTKEPL